MTKASSLSVAEPPVAPRLQLNPVIRFPLRRHLPAVWIRSGTSKGLFLHRNDLPPSSKLWEPILLSAMGSAQGNARQIDGIGGATSTTSKAAIIAKSSRSHADVDYTFVQVAPDRARIDVTGNCGNVASGVGPFALDEGIVKAAPGQKEVGTSSHSRANMTKYRNPDRHSNIQHKHWADDHRDRPGCIGWKLHGGGRLSYTRC